MEIGHERLAKLVDRLLGGEIVLPDIQRDFVWSGSQIPRLLDSLYREWPVGAILLWDTTIDVPIKTAAVVQGNPVGVRPTILLDGQQRLTTLARVIAPDRAPKGQKAPDVRFHPGRAEFLTANAVKAKDPAWLRVSDILKEGAQFMELLKPLELEEGERLTSYERLSEVAQRIRNYRLPVQTITEDNYETVAEIFNRVNTGGRRLSKGDLVMGALSARWRGGRQRVEAFEEDLRGRGWPINREVLLRVTSSLTRKSPNHIRLLELRTADEWQDGWEKTIEATNHAIGFLRADAGITGLGLLPTEYVLVMPSLFLAHTKGAFRDAAERDLARRWIFLASAFGHYSGSTETRLAADVSLLGSKPRAELWPRLLAMAQEPRTPEMAVTADDVKGKGMRSPFLKLLQIAAIKAGAKTWWSHRSITHEWDIRGMAVEVHHIFPRKWLSKNNLGNHPERDSLANFAFLSKHDNIKISDGDPAEYLAKAAPDELRTQWVPADPELWAIERFEDFCAERRRLLADGLNDLLGLAVTPTDDEPLEAEESPEPEVGAWLEGWLETVP